MAQRPPVRREPLRRHGTTSGRRTARLESASGLKANGVGGREKAARRGSRARRAFRGVSGETSAGETPALLDGIADDMPTLDDRTDQDVTNQPDDGVGWRGHLQSGACVFRQGWYRRAS